MASSAYAELQKIASDTQITLQRMTNEATAKSFEFNHKESEISRNWQKMMSDTSHAREVADLKKAGLNPVLSANQGAAAYSTSSASDHADNSASSLASIESSRMSGIAGMESSRISAAATRQAAATNAAAMKAAAAQQAAAAMYAADRQYNLGVYKADKEYQSKVLTNITSITSKRIEKAWDYKIAMDKPATTWAGVAGKIFAHGGFEQTIGGQLKGICKAYRTAMDFYNAVFTGNFSNFDNVRLSAFGRSVMDRLNRSVGLSVNNQNRNLMMRAVMLHDQRAISSLNSILKSQRATRHNNRQYTRMYW